MTDERDEVFTDEEQLDESVDYLVNPDTGERTPMPRQPPVRGFTNTRRGHDFLEVRVSRDQIHKTLMKAAVAAVPGLLMFLWVASHYIFEPRFERAVKEALAPMNSRVIELQSSNDVMLGKLNSMEREMLLRTELRWTVIDEKLQADKLRSLNPNLKVPEPVHIPLPGEIPTALIR